MQAGAGEAADGGVLQPGAVEAEAPQARVARHQRAEQVVRERHLEEVEGGEEGEGVGGAGAEAAAGGGGEEEGADVEAGENGGDDGGGKREVHRRRRRRGDGLDRIWRRHGARWWIGVGVGRWPESEIGRAHV